LVEFTGKILMERVALYMASAPPPRFAYREFKEVFVGHPPESRNNATTK
jgi:hypothetical protein